MNKTFSLTVNGQSLQFAVDAIGDTFQTSPYFAWKRDEYRELGKIGYGGYESGRVHVASTRTIANMVERHIKAQGWF